MLDFDSLYREFAPRVQRFVLGLSGDAAVAEDVTAETFVRVWATRDRVRHDTVRAFLFTIARNLWLQGIRSKWRQRALDADDADPAPGPTCRRPTGWISIVRSRRLPSSIRQTAPPS